MTQYKFPRDIKEAPGARGCYALFDGQAGCLYVGRSNNINRRLLEHTKREPLMRAELFQFWRSDDDAELETTLTKSLRPLFNRQESGKEAFTCRLDGPLYMRLRLYSVANHTSSAAVIARAVEAFLDANEKTDCR